MDFSFLRENILKKQIHIFFSYNIISFLLEQFGLIIEYRKSEVFHFSRSCGLFNSPLLNLNSIRGPILYSKDLWRYLRFIFDRKLLFWQYIEYYSNKALLTVKYMKLLGNSYCSLLPYQKYLFYRTCILFIVLYNFPL